MTPLKFFLDPPLWRTPVQKIIYMNILVIYFQILVYYYWNRMQNRSCFSLIDPSFCNDWTFVQVDLTISCFLNYILIENVNETLNFIEHFWDNDFYVYP